MIYDKLSNASYYEKQNAKFVKAFDFLRKCESEFPAPGKYIIDGDDVYAAITEYISFSEDEVKWEAHRKYLDIQYVFSGEELMGVGDCADMVEPAYDEKKDCALCSEMVSSFAVPMREGWFAVVYPQDAHKPRCAMGEKSFVRKVVVKIKID